MVEACPEQGPVSQERLFRLLQPNMDAKLLLTNLYLNKLYSIHQAYSYPWMILPLMNNLRREFYFYFEILKL